MSKKILLLWDIDGTLYKSPAGGATNIRLVKEMFDRDMIWDREFQGTSDGFIARTLLKRYGAEPTDERILDYKTKYLSYLESEIIRGGYQLLDGVPELLSALEKRSDIAMGLLTGNWELASEIKLKRAGIYHHFPVGAFSDDHYVRNELGPIALRKANAHFGTSFDLNNVWIIGDTPHDVACAHAAKAKALAVALGAYSVEELKQTRAECVMADFTDQQAFFRTIDSNET